MAVDRLLKQLIQVNYSSYNIIGMVTKLKSVCMGIAKKGLLIVK